MQASSTVKSLSSTHTSSHSLHSLVLSLSPSPLVAASFVAASFVAAPPTPSFCLTGTPERVPHPRGVYGAADTQAGHAAGRTMQGLQFPLSVSRTHAHVHTCTHMHTHAHTCTHTHHIPLLLLHTADEDCVHSLRHLLDCFEYAPSLASACMASCSRITSATPPHVHAHTHTRTHAHAHTRAHALTGYGRPLLLLQR